MEQIFISILLYSLVIGPVLAVLTGLTLTLTKHVAPSIRYGILVFLLGAFAVSIFLIAFWQIDSFSNTANIVISGRFEVTESQPPFEITAYTPHMTALVSDFLNNNSGTIILIWLLIVIAKTAKLTYNLTVLQYLKTRKLFPAGKYWDDKLLELSKQTGVNKAVKLMQSAIVQVPVVIGHFKPVVLIPLGMITAMNPKEIELILLHELAHIKRMDFFVNMLQNILEILFFFNPAVLWISSVIRKERENCCDEIVLQNTGSKKQYIQALLSFREYQVQVPVHAMAFAKESSLVARVKRIVSQKNSTLNSHEKGFLLLTVIALCTFGILHATGIEQRDPFPGEEQIKKKMVVPSENDTSKPLSAQRSLPGSQTQVDSSFRVDQAGKLKKQPALVEAQPEPDAIQPTNSLDLEKMPETAVPDIVPIRETKEPDTIPVHQPLFQPIKSNKGIDIQKMLSVVKSAGINVKGSKLAFHITNTSLVVNGILQPKDILNKVLGYYINSPNDRIDFSYNRVGGSLSIISNYYIE
jgi:beta-lactamase regulating signal transducer with metallopeptidase domain